MRSLLKLNAVIAVCLFWSGCLLDTGRQCSKEQDLTEANVCACKPNAIISATKPGSCELCPAGQVVMGGRCACPATLVMASDGSCVARPSGLGDACDPASTTCSNPQFSFCQSATGGGYCTKAGCAGTADCPSGFGCDLTVVGGVCKRPPSGQGKTCTGDSDCAGNEATFCAPVANVCYVEGCAVGAQGACHPGYRCCDLTPKGLAKNVCLPVEACP
jgi:hypothetical protein